MSLGVFLHRADNPIGVMIDKRSVHSLITIRVRAEKKLGMGVATVSPREKIFKLGPEY